MHDQCGSWLACDSGLTADTYLPDTPQSNCGSGLAREGGPGQSKQSALAPPLGTSLGLGVPVIRPRGLTGRLRSQADQDQERLASHRGYRLRLQPTELYVAITVWQSLHLLLRYRFRRQASSHMVLLCFESGVSHISLCQAAACG